jgi:hypothetical protein
VLEELDDGSEYLRDRVSRDGLAGKDGSELLQIVEERHRREE